MNLAKFFHHKSTQQPVTTVADLFASDDVKGIIKDLRGRQADIKELLICWVDRDSSVHWEVTSDTLESTAVWMLEYTKKQIMAEED